MSLSAETIKPRQAPLRDALIQRIAELEALPKPPTENELRGAWRAGDEYLVSICMLTFNHAPYVARALDGILDQQTDFGYEILVHDDASSDGTQDILLDYARRYPSIVKPVLQHENQWSQGINPSIATNYPRANAPFVAWCEGDDMWVDRQKLQTQIDSLRLNPQIGLSFHQAIMLNYGFKQSQAKVIGNYGATDRVVSFHDTIYRPYGLIPTASCIVRQEVKQRLFQFMKSRPYLRQSDIFLQFFGALRTGALYHARPMSVYRFQTRHSLTRGLRDSRAELANHQASVIRAYVDMHIESADALSAELKRLVFQRLFWLFNRHPIGVKTIEDLNLNRLAKLFLSIKRDIRAKIERLNTLDGDIVIYGCGSGCALILEHLDRRCVRHIIDRDGLNERDFLFGIPVIGPTSHPELGNSLLVVSTLATDHSEIERLANSQGLSRDRIDYFFDAFIEDIDLWALNEDRHEDLGIGHSNLRRGWWPRRIADPKNSPNAPADQRQEVVRYK